MCAYSINFTHFIERTKRLKQAKDEAANEVEAFKAEKEKQHKILEQQVI